MSSFEALFGMAGTAEVDYIKAPEVTLEILSETDKISTAARKMRDLAGVVLSGESVAVATRFAGARYQERDPERLAAMSFTPQEAAQYAKWRDEETCFPGFNRSENVDNSPIQPEGLECMQDRANAMNIIWRTDKLQPGHALWLTKNWGYMLPLITAVGMVEAEKHNLVGGSQELTANEMAEIETIEEVCKAAKNIAINKGGRYNNKNLIRDIRYSEQTLMDRKHAIQKKTKGHMPTDHSVKKEKLSTTTPTAGSPDEMGLQ